MTREELRAELDKFQEKALLKSSLAWDTFDTLKETVLARVQKLQDELKEANDACERLIDEGIAKSKLIGEMLAKEQELEGRFAEIRKLAKEMPSFGLYMESYSEETEVEAYRQYHKAWVLWKKRLERLVGERYYCDKCGGLGYLGVLSNINLDPNATIKCPKCKGTGLKEGGET